MANDSRYKVLGNMFTLENLVDAIHSNRIRISDHADEEAQADHLSFEEIFVSVLQGEIIETYSDDRPCPSCLVYGTNMKREPIHSVWAYNSTNQWGVLITVYRPNPERWIDWKKRRTK